jgi:hypothetical protein
MIAADDAVVLHEIEQIGHLFEIRWNIGIVAPQMHIVELDVHDLFDLAGGSLQAARCLCGCRFSNQQRGTEQQRGRGAKNARETHGLSPDVNEGTVRAKFIAPSMTLERRKGDTQMTRE